MCKKIFFTLLLTLLTAAVPLRTTAAPAVEIIENDLPSVVISVSSESVLHVSGAAGQTLSIYNVTGLCVMNVKVDSSEKSYPLNLPKGCYIVKVGKVVRKISIR